MIDHFPFFEHFTVAQSDVVERMREELTDAEIYVRWNHSVGKQLTRKSASEVAAYLERNPRSGTKLQSRG